MISFWWLSGEILSHSYKAGAVCAILTGEENKAHRYLSPSARRNTIGYCHLSYKRWRIFEVFGHLSKEMGVVNK